MVEVGSGDKRGQGGWLTIDITRNCDIFWDLRKGLPFPDDSVKKIYSSHFFEHLSFRETQKFLVECKRALAPGGKFLVCVPNARIYLEAYVKGVPLDSGQFFGYRPAFNHTTSIDCVNYVAYMDGEHKYMFDEENLLFVLTANGFKNARPRQFDPALDLAARDFESIYAEAEK
jgi:predicted SAM-dependent methyltransferase